MFSEREGEVFLKVLSSMNMKFLSIFRDLVVPQTITFSSVLLIGDSLAYKSGFYLCILLQVR